MVKILKERNGCVFEASNLRGEIWLCSILLRRSVVYFLRANIKGEVWLIVPEWEFQGRIWLCARVVILYLLT